MATRCSQTARWLRLFTPANVVMTPPHLEITVTPWGPTAHNSGPSLAAAIEVVSCCRRHIGFDSDDESSWWHLSVLSHESYITKLPSDRPESKRASLVRSELPPPPGLPAASGVTSHLRGYQPPPGLPAASRVTSRLRGYQIWKSL